MIQNTMMGQPSQHVWSGCHQQPCQPQDLQQGVPGQGRRPNSCPTAEGGPGAQRLSLRPVRSTRLEKAKWLLTQRCYLA